MFEIRKKWILFVCTLFVSSEDYVSASAFDQQLYEDVLDPVLCQQQLTLLRNHPLRNQFYDASFRIPSGILTGHVTDLGDYHQCLGIDQIVEDFRIQGKYCTVIVPMNQDPIDWPNLPQWPPTIPPEWNFTLPINFTILETDFGTTVPDPTDEIDVDVTEQRRTDDKSVNIIEKTLLNEAKRNNINISNMKTWALRFAGLHPKPDATSRIIPSVFAQIGMTLAVCIPKTCTTNQAMEAFQELAPFLDVSFRNYYCRLPQDKPFVTADYVAIGIFTSIGLLTVISTMHDLYHTFYIKKTASSVLRSFSVYTNTRRLLNFNPSADPLDCIDGIRSISMMWIIVAHTYAFSLSVFVHNMQNTLKWLTEFSSVWINAAPISVDTFFLLGGILVVYITLSKVSRGPPGSYHPPAVVASNSLLLSVCAQKYQMLLGELAPSSTSSPLSDQTGVKRRFLRSLHLFYLNRLLRTGPLLAAVVLLQASLFNHVTDGPFWQNVAYATENCRRYWWAALLHVQNYVNPLEICLNQSWYISVDTQLYIAAPLVLWWLWGHPRGAWTALTFATLLSLVSTSLYSFLNNFGAAFMNISRLTEVDKYMTVYYFNTLTRAPPYIIGMIYGYLLYMYKGRKVRINKFNICILWILSFIVMSFCIFSTYPVMQWDHEAQTLDNFLNAYMRALWACALGWLIFACVKGYGGPINWFLSLQMWKLPARLSYAMYLIHIPIIQLINGTWVKTHYFSSEEAFHRFTANFMLTLVAAFALCVIIDAPCSTLQKLLMGGGTKRPQKPIAEEASPAA